jgi:hypothetical protein
MKIGYYVPKRRVPVIHWRSHTSEECRPQNACSLKFRFRGFKVLHQIFLSQNLFYLHSEVAGTRYQFVCPWLCSVAGVRGTQATDVAHIDQAFLRISQRNVRGSVFMPDSGGQGLWLINFQNHVHDYCCKQSACMNMMGGIFKDMRLE